jgi:hypothetical protein
MVARSEHPGSRRRLLFLKISQRRKVDCFRTSTGRGTRKNYFTALNLITIPSSELMTVAEIFLNFGIPGKFGGLEVFFLRGIPSGVDTISMDNKRDPMLPVILHHQECKCLWPCNKFPVYFKC